MKLKKLITISLIQLLLVSVLSASSISGKVTIDRPSGAVSVEGADVYAFNTTSKDSLGYTATTDKDGKYLLDNLPAGNYEVMVQTGDLFGNSDSIISLGENEALTDINILLSGDGFILYDNGFSGIVKDATTGEAVSKVSISLLSVSTDSVAGDFVYSLDDGTFEITNIIPGNYNLTAYAYGFAEYNYNQVIAITEDKKITNFEINLTPFASGDASLSGTVTNSVTSEAVKDVTIFVFGDNYIMPTDSLGGFVVTNENGKYQMDNLVSGKYWYYTELEGYKSTWGEVEVNGETTFDISIVQLVSGTIEGIVLDENGKPMPNSFVEFIPSTPENYNYSYVRTDAKGKYSVEVGIGDYYVSCSLNNFDSTKFDGTQLSLPVQLFYENALTIEDATIISVKENQTKTDINFTVPAIKKIEVVITGSVKDDSGNGIEGAEIVAWLDNYFYACVDSASMENIATTDANGNYTLTISQESYEPLNITLFAYKEGFVVEYYNEKSEWYFADVITVNESGAKENINFTLSNESAIYGNSISGKVSDKDGNGLADIFVSALNIDGYSWEKSSTDVDGNYTIQNLKEEDYVISFFSFDSFIPELYNDVLTWEEATPVKASGDVLGIDAVLAKGEAGIWDSSRAIIGNISDVAGKALANVVVVLKNNAGKAVASARTDAKGNYRSVTKSNQIGEVIVSKVGYKSITKSLDKYSPVANTVILNVSLKKSVTDVDNSSLGTIPSKFALQQNFPNPFNPTTVINFSLPVSQNVKLEVFNLLGENIVTLLNKPMSAGNHKYEFDASNFNSGLYLYRISTGSFVDVKKMMLLK